MHVPADTEFQFHKGTIKTIYLINLLARFCDFNSIKVRLKVSVSAMQPCPYFFISLPLLRE